MFVKKDISSDDIGEDPTVMPVVADYPTKHSVFYWPQHSNLIEKLREQPWNISEQTKLTLKELDLYQEDLTTHGMKAPNTCSVVLVAEPFLQDFSAVMDIVDRLSNDMKRIPYAMVLIMENTSTTLNLSKVTIPTALVSTTLNIFYCYQIFTFYR